MVEVKLANSSKKVMIGVILTNEQSTIIPLFKEIKEFFKEYHALHQHEYHFPRA